MHLKATVERVALGGLAKERWVFWVCDRGRIYLDEYERMTRPSLRHKFEAGASYSRLYPREAPLKYENVPLPAEVVEQATADVRGQIVFVGKFTR